MDTFEQIENYYENYDEEGRMFRDRMLQLEYLTTIRYFDRLFVPGSRILDACAGTGRYAFYLADKGHVVTACDLVEHHVSIMKSKPMADKLAGAYACNTLDLSQFSDSSFDVVLCMGALYHLRSNDAQEKAVAECVRVCKAGGIVALAYVTKIGAFLCSINADASNMATIMKFMDGTDDGVFNFSAIGEIEAIALKSGLHKMHNIGTDGIVRVVGSKLAKANEADFQKYMNYHDLTCEDESIIGTSLHGLWIGKKC
ncbi:MAG: class I SAM-dependent methyltransferase [Phycisphaerales bacterium]|nr:class I SAM-dependent methyltransferase [Phycisphaerales bacterium]